MQSLNLKNVLKLQLQWIKEQSKVQTVSTKQLIINKIQFNKWWTTLFKNLRMMKDKENIFINKSRKIEKINKNQNNNLSLQLVMILYKKNINQWDMVNKLQSLLKLSNQLN